MSRRAICLVILLTMSFTSVPASAWNGLDGNDVPPHTAWPGLPVSWYLHQNGSADLGGFSSTRPIVQAAFDEWMSPSCTVWETTYEGTTSTWPGPDGTQVVAWIESSWPFDSVAIGVASTYTAGPTSARRIVEADISFNGEDYTWNTTGTGGGVDAQSIATHEIGHFLGLDHDGCSAGETMCAGYSGGTDFRSISADDITGVCSVYPAGCSTTADCPPSFECVGSSCVAVPGQPCEPCDYPGECGGSDDYCLSGFSDGGSYCGQNCTTDDDCPWRYVCEALTTGEYQCLPYNFSCDPPPTPECDDDADCTGTRETCDDLLCVGLPCAPCDDHWDCGAIDDHCLSGFPDGGEYCGQGCTDTSDCPWGYECEAVVGGDSQCLPYTGTCDPAPAPQCTVDGDCPDGYLCRDQRCEGELCAPCEEHWECGPGNACLTSPVDSRTYCAHSCETDSDCPWGYLCTGTGLGLMCFPYDQDCATPPEPECATDDDCTEPGTRCIDQLCLQCATDEDCPGSQVCLGGWCVEEDEGLPMCAECTTHDECGDENSLCVTGFTDGTRRCGVSCSSVGGECGEGNTCMSLGSMTDQCLPTDMDCTDRCVFDTDCAEPDMCTLGNCVSDCDPSDLLSCRAGHYCRFVDCTTGVCAAGTPGEGAFGEPCTSDLDCASMRCMLMLDGGRCSAQCDPTPDDCDLGACQPGDDPSCGFCSCSAGMLGDVCETDAQCQSGMCAHPWPGTCAMECPGGGCPTGFGCAGVDGVDICVPAAGSMGNSCTTNEDCASGICTAHVTGSHCTRACNLEGCDCPEGWECSDDGSGAMVCVDPAWDAEPEPEADVVEETDGGTVDPVPTGSSGCGCTMVGASPGPGPLAITFLLALSGLAFFLRSRG